MEGSVAGLVLLAALLHAGWNVLVKVDGDRLVAMALIAGSAGAVSILCLPVLPVPAPASWPYIAASLALHTGYKLFLLQAYRHGDLGQVYPIARGAAPAIVALLALIVAGEALSAFSLAAMCLIIIGIVSLAFRGGAPVGDDPRPVLYALGTALFIAGYTLVDGLGARLAGTPHGYAAWLFALDGVPITAIALWRRGNALLSLLRRRWRPGVAGGCMSLGAYWLVIWALTLGPMGPVAALRETSVLFAALLGTVLLKERFGPWRIGAAALVAAGIVLLRL